MDYIKIHDSLISRARCREYNTSIHHLHHIIPKHESEDSTDVVPVTFKEHYLLHYLRSKFIKHTTGNYVAYCFMRGIKNIDKHKFMASEGGKMGGRTTKDSGKGIFSPEWDRSAQSKKNWENGMFDHVDFVTNGKIAGKKCRDTNSGIFREDLKHLRTEWAKIGAKALNQAGTRKGCATHEWTQAHPDKQKENASKGGKLGGKVVGSLPWWTDGVINKRALESPGEFWRLGMTKKVKPIPPHMKRKNIQ